MVHCGGAQKCMFDPNQKMVLYSGAENDFGSKPKIVLCGGAQNEYLIKPKNGPV